MISRTEGIKGQNSLRYFPMPILIKIKKKTIQRDKLTWARNFQIERLLEYFIKESMQPPALCTKKVPSSKLHHLV